jgi:hypothetical protein
VIVFDAGVEAETVNVAVPPIPTLVAETDRLTTGVVTEVGVGVGVEVAVGVGVGVAEGVGVALGVGVGVGVGAPPEALYV